MRHRCDSSSELFRLACSQPAPLRASVDRRPMRTCSIRDLQDIVDSGRDLGQNLLRSMTTITNDIVLRNYVFSNGNYQGGTVPFAPGAVSGFSMSGLNYATALNAGEVIDQSTLGGFAFSLALGDRQSQCSVQERRQQVHRLRVFRSGQRISTTLGSASRSTTLPERSCP